MDVGAGKSTTHLTHIRTSQSGSHFPSEKNICYLKPPREFDKLSIDPPTEAAHWSKHGSSRKTPHPMLTQKTYAFFFAKSMVYRKQEKAVEIGVFETSIIRERKTNNETYTPKSSTSNLKPLKEISCSRVLIFRWIHVGISRVRKRVVTKGCHSAQPNISKRWIKDILRCSIYGPIHIHWL